MLSKEVEDKKSTGRREVTLRTFEETLVALKPSEIRRVDILPFYSGCLPFLFL